MVENDDLEKELNSIGEKPDLWRDSSGMVDRNVTKAMKALGLTMIRADRTNSKLAKMNLWLAMAVLVAAIVQVVLMLRGK